MNDFTCCELFDSIPEAVRPLFARHTYAHEVLSEIGDYIKKLIPLLPSDYKEISPGVYVAEGTAISPLATILPPAIIGGGCEIRPGAYLRGNVIICDNTVVGNSTEIKNSVLFKNVTAPHYNYIGDSVLGNYVHIGAGVILSNLKSDRSSVCIHGEEELETGLRKMGAIIGDNAEVGCGTVLNPGTVIGKSTNIYPCSCVRGVVPSHSIYKSADNIVKKRQKET